MPGVLEEWGLPGLVRVMEERLGRFGRPLTTVFVIAVMLAVFVWAADLVHTKAVSPIAKTIAEGGLPDSIGAFLATHGEVLAVYGFGMAIAAAVYAYLTFFVVTYPTKRRLERQARDFREHKRMHDEDPTYRHIVINTPLDAREARDEIYDVIIQARIDAVADLYRAREEMGQRECAGQRQQALEEETLEERDGQAKDDA